ncbi:MAG: 1,4-dihydroxy-2-naphthoate octaprenyltransferase [Planctomycetaceae bacterium]|jgi:1,4-dihydroxy-2-naphthoate octaprenyltransferase|nr:1,4-dihydroxy-2-naphthoate octaprenyltransferase [Planctomycetaceae bacterium]
MGAFEFKSWIAAARPKTLTASISPVLVAWALAYSAGTLKWIPAILCLSVAFFAQIAANFVNDYFDFKKGADTSERLGQPRAVASGWITPEAMLRGALITLGVACLCGCGLLFFSDWWLIFVGITIAIGVIAYSAGPYPLAYHGWGDICVLVFYGVVPLCFTYYVCAGEFTLTVFLLSLVMGFLSTNILVVNNYRDFQQDKAAGKHTSIVIFGLKFGRILYLVNAIFAVIFAYPVYGHRSMGIWFMFVVFLLIELFTWKDLSRLHGSELNRTLEITARNVLLFAMLLVFVLLKK